MFVYPYDTTVCSYITSNLIKAIKAAEVTEGLESNIADPGLKNDNAVNWKHNFLFVTSRNSNVPPFAHPIEVDFGADRKRLVIDARGFSKIVQGTGSVITNRSEFNFAMIRAVLTNHMAMGSPKDLLTLGTFPMLVYARWLSENVTKRQGLSPVDQMRLMVIACYFYLGLFRDDKIQTDIELNKNAQLIAKATYAPIDLCFQIADQLMPMQNIKEFVTQVITILDTPRLEKYSAGLLINTLINSWFGNNSREIVAVALEHPPTWLALVYAAINDRNSKNSNIAKVVFANDKKDVGKTFTYNLLNLVE